jgi:hypothetical protein
MDIHIREYRLPGVGHRYELGLPRGRRLIVVVQDGGRRDLGLVSGAADVPDVIVSLTADQAVAVAALLTGARFSIGSTGVDPVDAGDVAIETVTLPSSAGNWSTSACRPVPSSYSSAATANSSFPKAVRSSAAARRSFWPTPKPCHR